MDPKDFPKVTRATLDYSHRNTKNGPVKAGPYWYGYWRENGKARRVYIGKELPKELADIPGTALRFPGRSLLVWPGRPQRPQFTPLKFMLYCNKDPRDLGIEDDQGNWDMAKFKEHILECTPCQKFLDILGEVLLDDLTAALSAARS